ncbi:TusE/DsrC/DsvC family sulfur relay protein [Marinicella sp. S1101]|uniref:TusE/DsrC/DsvC family sulfur relay protein n=1 Tax=Marinicella marina TaxID=2996016 RepID=UPI0022608245|nr:TusE/DsrC/DsvC family sulfur relay protein [Marinicella marina]MCX7554959.1 TusE/DsrC/DsvC family sulfur relay protein [Marinicella marina]MDJ1141569.1 TusE/DsrC/DsvC family sulfur relay protein [Marinicella marina]
MEVKTANLTIKTDAHGHLTDRSDWNREVAQVLAANDGIELTPQHWQLIETVQNIYDATGDTPPMRLLIKLLRQKLDPEIDSRYLYRLYPDGPVRFASKHAGLPKPKHCM